MSSTHTIVERILSITVNGEVHKVHSGCTLAELIDQLGHAPAQIATALNGDFVTRDQRSQHLVRDGDRVNCFQAIVGG
jgi:sulfur carrier protein